MAVHRLAPISRRHFLATTAASLAAGPAFADATPATSPCTKGVVLYPFDLSLGDWPERAARAGINTIGLHAARRLDVLHDFVASDEGQSFLHRCKALGIQVEYELHAMSDLLSRELWFKDRSMFRMDEKGRRTPVSNCCPHSAAALEVIAERAVKWARILTPTTGRYFYWPDDGSQWCHCPECEGLSASEQALLVENRIVRALRRFDPRATVSHISYHTTLAAPKQVKPEAGIFLEFAPYSRNLAKPIASREAKTRRSSSPGDPNPEMNAGYLDILKANMQVFEPAQAQVLEYWLDVSLYGRPAAKVPFDPAVCRADIAAYRKLGVRHITTFAAFIDADYAKLHGDPQREITAYGEALNAT